MIGDNDIIYGYTRAQAIKDGYLIEVPKTLLDEARITLPMALTKTVWHTYVEWDESDNAAQTYQKQESRLYDILLMFKLYGKHTKSNYMHFKVLVIPKDGHSVKPVEIPLYAHVHPGDNGEPIITIQMHEGDD